MAEFDASYRYPTSRRFDRKKIVPQQDVIASGTSAVFGCEGFSQIGVLLKVGTATGTSPTLDVRLQTSYDAASTWVDIAASVQITTSNDVGNILLTHYAVDSDGGGDVSAVATDGSLTAATYKTWPLGDRFRLKWTIGGTDTPTVPLEAWAILRRD